jgi:hypothetical protein
MRPSSHLALAITTVAALVACHHDFPSSDASRDQAPIIDHGLEAPQDRAIDAPADRSTLDAAPDLPLKDRGRDKPLLDKTSDKPKTDKGLPDKKLGDSKKCNGDPECALPGPTCLIGKCSGVCVTQTAPAGTVCRKGTGACDPDETCDGSATTCPADVAWSQKPPVLFKTSWGWDGFANDAGQTNYDFIQAGCGDFGSGSQTVRRGFISFDTSSLPSAGAIVSAELQLCAQAGNGVDDAWLYEVTTPFPYNFGLNSTTALQAFNTAAINLNVSIPNAMGPISFAVPASTIKRPGPTQYSMRYPSCPGVGAYNRHWASAGSTSLTNCPSSSAPYYPPTLKVTYCAP